MNNVSNVHVSFIYKRPMIIPLTAKVQAIQEDNILEFVVYKMVYRLQLVPDCYQIPFGRYALRTGSLPPHL